MTDFEKVYREYFDDVYRYILRLSRDEHLAEDITSDTFFRALRAIDDFRGECELRVWLCQIARNCYYEHRKKTARTERRENAALQSDRTAGESLEERVARQDEAAQLRTLLHELPEPLSGGVPLAGVRRLELSGDRTDLSQERELGLRDLSPGAEQAQGTMGGVRA